MISHLGVIFLTASCHLWKISFPPPLHSWTAAQWAPYSQQEDALFYKDFQTHCIGMYITVYAWFLPKDQLTVTFEGQISWFATVFGKINLGLVAHGVLRGVYYVHVLWGSPVVKRQQKQQKQQMQSWSLTVSKHVIKTHRGRKGNAWHPPSEGTSRR